MTLINESLMKTDRIGRLRYTLERKRSMDGHRVLLAAGA